VAGKVSYGVARDTGFAENDVDYGWGGGNV
jgi:hypothetical protein